MSANGQWKIHSPSQMVMGCTKIKGRKKKLCSASNGEKEKIKIKINKHIKNERRIESF
jgi:hypothetical protein